jgi:flavin reductase (DIM6/NTAB) family NADH-FMN oxidoreductase RutF
MAIDPKHLRNVMGHFATGVTIVTVKDAAGKPFGLTANALSSLSLDPPLLLICVDKGADCYGCFEESRLFAVNILSEDQEDLSRRFATKGIDKFEGVRWREGKLGVPLIEGTLGQLECRVTGAHEGGDHTIYVGEIVSAQASGDRPLLFFKGQYHGLPPS